MGSKRALRRTAQRDRQARGPSDALEAVLAPLLATATQVASYVAFGAEPALAPRPGWLLPVLLEDDDLDWARYDGRLAPGRRGLQEPVGPRLGVDAVAGCDLVLVPALLVDRRGNRLGKGGGSYDRALRRARGLTVALLHDDELVEELPAEPHDVAVAAVATPSLGLVRLPGR
ncbi:MAG: 5-formyltetrahydrofolate cyclo-ligase [Frankiales bacterium]|jgi:5-formyltetrahydrofolate cyclo-ligase|nr:5-formyltetrahydrofolate cyclo-ligase [Frankiales bacterium]